MVVIQVTEIKCLLYKEMLKTQSTKMSLLYKKEDKSIDQMKEGGDQQY